MELYRERKALPPHRLESDRLEKAVNPIFTLEESGGCGREGEHLIQSNGCPCRTDSLALKRPGIQLTVVSAERGTTMDT